MAKVYGVGKKHPKKTKEKRYDFVDLYYVNVLWSPGSPIHLFGVNSKYAGTYQTKNTIRSIIPYYGITDVVTRHIIDKDKLNKLIIQSCAKKDIFISFDYYSLEYVSKDDVIEKVREYIMKGLS